MKDIVIPLTKVPTKIEDDLNRGLTTWRSGRLVEFNENSKYTNFYINHIDELSDNIDGETVVTTKAFHIRVKKPVTINNVVIEAEKLAYQIPSDEDYVNFKIELSNLIQENPDDTRIIEHSRFIQWVKDGYYIIKGVSLEEAKNIMLRKIKDYDTSKEVNSFYLNDQLVWLDKETRVGLMNSITIEKSVGLINTTLWLNTQSYTLPIDLAIQLLAQLEIYAKNCYNKTSEHKANLEKLTITEEVMEYNYKEGYPEKLRINI